MSCDRCGEYPGATFCPYCGERLDGEAPPKEKTIGILTALASISILLSVVLLVVELIGMWTGAGATFEWLADKGSNILVLIPHLAVAGRLEGLSLQLYWLMLVAVITVSAVFLFMKSKDAFVTESYRNGDVENTPLFWTAVCFSASVVITLGLNAIMSSMGTGITVPDSLPVGNSCQALFEYADAAVWEEIISRVLYIGVPMTVAALYVGKSKWWKCLFGGFGMSRLAVVLIFVSAMVFAFAHMGAWGFTKVIPVFFGGVLFGYLFVRFGLYACIMMHFLTDYMVVATETAMTLSGFIMLGLMIIGFVSLAYLLRHLYRNRWFWKEVPNLIEKDD